MARLFDDAASQYLIHSVPIVTAKPFTYACWFNTDADLSSIPIGISSETDNFHGSWLRLDTVDNQLQAREHDGGTSSASTSTFWSVDTWHHGCAVFAATDDRRVFLDGGGKGTSAVARSPTNLSNTTIGAVFYAPGPGADALFSGRLAEVAIWNVALSDLEVNLLAKGAHPFQIRPQNLLGYWAEVRDDLDRSGIARFSPFHMTPTNSPTFAPHPPKIHRVPSLAAQFIETGELYEMSEPLSHTDFTTPVRRRWILAPIGLGDLSINVSDALTLGESTTLDPVFPHDTSEVDALTLGESVSLDIPIEISEADGLTLGESVAVDPVSLTEISESDGLTLGESVSVSIPEIGVHTISVSDAITLGEATIVTPLTVDASVSDALTIGESVTISIPDITLAISESDGITLGEADTVSIVGIAPDPDISESESIAIGEEVTVLGLLGQAGPPWKTRKVERGIEIPEKRILTNIRAQNEQLAEKREKERAQLAFQERREAAKERIIQRDQDAAEYEIRREMRRETSLENLELARMAREEEAKRQKKILAKRKRSLKKARAVKAKKK